MTQGQYNKTLVEGILKTILAFDILESKLTLADIQYHLFFAKGSEKEILDILDFLCAQKILIQENKYYLLYAKQEESLHGLHDVDISLPQKVKIILLSKFFNLSGVSILNLPTQNTILIIRFHEHIKSFRKEQVCTLFQRIIGLQTCHSGVIPFQLRNSLVASLLVNVKPLVNPENLKDFWQLNSWIFNYCSNSTIDFSNLIVKNLDSQKKQAKKKRNSSFKSTGKSNLATLMQQLLDDSAFQESFAERSLYYDQWLLPKIAHAIKRNRIV